jgi:hypothetical protein
MWDISGTSPGYLTFSYEKKREFSLINVGIDVNRAVSWAPEHTVVWFSGILVTEEEGGQLNFFQLFFAERGSFFFCINIQ